LLPRSAQLAVGPNEVMHMDDASRHRIERYRSETFHRSSSSVGQYWNRLISDHHRVTDLQATNTLVSHSIDYALRNVVIFLVLGVIGLNPFALLIATATNISGTFSHCGGDVKGGKLNYLFVMPSHRLSLAHVVGLHQPHGAA
jgi:sterol desaturase/sphingolipid hydroxylase (fatty acid hydroxylase superfamily)